MLTATLDYIRTPVITRKVNLALSASARTARVLNLLILSTGEKVWHATTACLYFPCYLQADAAGKDLDSGGPRPSAGPALAGTKFLLPPAVSQKPREAMTTGKELRVGPQTRRAYADRSPGGRSGRAPLTQDEAGAKVIEFATMPQRALSSQEGRKESL
jgi:hypothetical protein